MLQTDNLFFDVIDSTNTYAKNHFSSFNKNKMTCITAKKQTKGKGRNNREWFSPEGNLYTTFSFRLKNRDNIIHLAQVLSFSLSSLLLENNLGCLIKWPNDILLSKKKLAGILCETIIEKDEFIVILGIGINVNSSKEILNHIDQEATSLYIETHKQWDIDKLLHNLQINFLNDLDILLTKGFSPFHDKIEDLLAYKNKEVVLVQGKKITKGILHSLANNGGINLLLEDKKIHAFLSGDISLKLKS